MNMRALLTNMVSMGLLVIFPVVGEQVLRRPDSCPSARANSRPGVKTPAFVLVGGGSLSAPVRQRFLELAGGKAARIVLIPSASSQPDAAASSYAFWKTADVASIRVLNAANRLEADDPRIYSHLRDA